MITERRLGITCSGALNYTVLTNARWKWKKYTWNLNTLQNQCSSNQSVHFEKVSRGQTFFSYWVTWTLKLKHFKNCCFSYINTWARIYVFESELKWKQLRSDPWKWIDFKICTILNYILITCLSGKQTRSSQYIHISKQINFVEEKAIWDKLILIQEKLLNGMFVYRVCILKWYVNMSCL